MSISKRIAHTEQEVHTYIDEVLDGTIPACRFTKLALQRHLDDLQNGHERGLWFDTTEAFRAVSFFPTMTLWDGPAKGQPFELLPHWKFIIWCVFGWKQSDGYRRFRVSYNEIARKAAKALCLSTEIPHTSGYTQVSDIKIGDKVLDLFGKSCNVIDTTEIFYNNTCYKVTICPKNRLKEKQEIICDAGHLWAGFCNTYSGLVGFTIDTETIKGILKNKNVFYIQSEYPKKEILEIVNIEKVPSVPVKCISVDSPDNLFLISKSFIPTHNSSVIGGALNYMFLLDDEGGAQIYSAATKRDQARIIWKTARNLLRGSGWANQLKFYQYKIINESAMATFEYLSADGDTMDGLGPHGVGLDEYHQAKNSKVFDSLSTGMGQRPQPLMWIPTTAGMNIYSPCYKLREYVVDILKGNAQNDKIFGIIFTLDLKADWPDLVGSEEDKPGKKEDDFRNPEVWEKPNPGIPWNVPFRTSIEAEVKKAVDMPSTANAIITKHFNVWTNQSERWIGMDLWDTNAKEVTWESFRAKQVFGGTDLAGISDLTCHAWVRSSEDDGIYVKLYSWCTRAWLEDSTNKYADSFLQWAKEGHIFIQEGNAIDYEAIRQYLDKEARRLKLNIHSSNVDRGFDGHEFAVRFDELLGGTPNHPKVALATAMQLTTSIDKAERLLLDGKLHHDGNPVLRFCINNAAIKTSTFDERRRVDKAGSHGKIDGVIALLLAIDRWMRTADSVFGMEGYEMPVL